MKTDLISQEGSLSKPLLLLLVISAAALAAGALWVPDRIRATSNSFEIPSAPVSLNESKAQVTGGQQYTVTIPVQGSANNDAADLWKAFEEILRVERVSPKDNEALKKRSLAKSDFRQMQGIIREFEGEGLTGKELYDATEGRLLEANARGALKMLDGYRRLEENLATADLDSMGPEARFEHIVNARRDAFGEETAEDLFFEKEAYTRYKLEEKAIAEDTGLTGVEKQAEIISRRNTLQVELASRGSYISFADERRYELDRRLEERHGEAVEAMSEEERSAAIWDLYREELPPEMMAKAEKVLAAQAQRRAAFEAHLQQKEAILIDEEMSFEEKQDRLAELSAAYNAGR